MLAKEYIKIYSEICYLTNDKTKCWEKLIKYSETLPLDVKRKFLWVWPDKHNLERLFEQFKLMKIDCLLSIGCGNGLLEWIMKESIGTDVYGLEIDRNWWQSSYAVQSFIPLNYVEDLPTDSSSRFLQQCCNKTDWNFALLFCYFNNRKAFNSYLHMYKGHHIIIIGPNHEIGIHTDPSPLQPNFPSNSQWQLTYQMFITATDIIAFYKKL